MMHRLRRYDVFRFAQNDVAPLRSAMMRCLPQCAVRHTSLGVAVIIGVANIICRRQTSFKKRTFVGRQKCVFCWQGQKDSILARPTRSVFRGSDSPPDCHSLPLPFESANPRTEKSQSTNALASFWQGQKDSNPRPMVLETSTLPTELYPFKRKYYNKVFCVCQGLFKRKTKKIQEKCKNPLTNEKVCVTISNVLREWRNWQTRTFEGRVVLPYGFDSRFPHHKKMDTIGCPFFCDTSNANIEHARVLARESGSHSSVSRRELAHVRRAKSIRHRRNTRFRGSTTSSPSCVSHVGSTTKFACGE